MRIISGSHKGLRIQAPAKLPVRPTTDQAKEALFNILQHSLDFYEMNLLDLFSGTGNISYEFASRGCTAITAVDKHPACVQFIKETSKKLNFQIDVVRADVFKYLESAYEKFDLIFADPPYDLNRIPEIAERVLKNNLLKEDGLLVIEHASVQQLNYIAGFVEDRKYGSSTFSFFSSKNL